MLRRAIAVPIAFAVLAVVLAGCGLAVGVGATVGVAAYQERGIEGVARDARIEATIAALWFRFNHELPLEVSVEAYEGRALLTGAVSDEGMRADAVRLAWKAQGVTEVLNEILVLEDVSILDRANDSWITTQLTSRLTFDREVYAINYAVETVNAIVYLIGIAQNQAEMDRVMAHARAIDSVRRIVNHVRVLGGAT